MNRRTPLLTTSDLEISRFDHPAGLEHHDPSYEISECYEVSFVERGRLLIETGGRRWQLAAGDLFLTSPGMRYRCEHAEAFPNDVFLSMCPLGSLDRCWPVTWLERITPIVPANIRLGYLEWRLAAALAAPGSAADAEGTALEVLAALSTLAESQNPRHRHAQLTWYAERVHAAREMITDAYDQELSLADLARAVGMSTFCFARVFSEMVGLPPHRFLTRVRMQAAAQRLRDGASVTDTCYAVGFRNLSHFIRCFRRRFGVSPSRYRQKPVN